MATWNEENAAHLLSRAGFGGDDRDIAKYVRYGQTGAVDRLVDVHGKSAKPPGHGDNDAEDEAKMKAWWAKRMVKATTGRLQEKMCLFWHDHFASGLSVVKNNLWMALQNRTFRLHGLGPFHTLVLEITRDPAMLEFLDGDRNRVGKPNENYAREVMELFVLGVSDLDGHDNYTQSDVVNLARAFTGFQIVGDKGVFNATRFDAGNKTLFSGTSFQATGNIGVVDANGVLFPPATNAIDILFTHRDSDDELTMPRYLAKKLWEYFAYPAPTKVLLDALTSSFIASGFEIRELLRSIFMHDEFYSATAKTSSVKNPCEFAFHAIRALKAKTNAETLPSLLAAMGMDLFDPPSVNGWNNGLAWLSSGQFLARFEFAQLLAAGRDGTLKLTPKKVFNGGAISAGPVVDELLARLGIAAHVPASVRQALIDYFGGATDFTDETVVEQKVRGAIALMLDLPEFQLH